MDAFAYKGKTYNVDSGGFLVDQTQWDADFSEGMAVKMKIQGELTGEHWRIIKFIRNAYNQTGRCPLVYETCRASGLSLKSLKSLFPSGYLRGACKLAGLTYREGYLKQSWLEVGQSQVTLSEEKVYRVDVRGFLIDPREWDKNFAIYKAYELKMLDGLTTRHWQIISFLRDSFEKTNTVPTFFETCEGNQLELDEMEKLFPDGYHRGAVKISGLRVR